MTRRLPRMARKKTKNSTDNTWINRTEITRKQKWEEKQLYGRFKRLRSDISYKETWMWLKKGRETLREKANHF